MTEQVYKEIFRIPIPLPDNPLKGLNAYYIRGRERSLLIDTGFRLPACRAALEAGLAEVGADLDRTDIFLTHAHADHSGLAPELIHSRCRIMVGREDVERLDVSARARLWEVRDSRFVKEGFDPRDAGAISGSAGRRYACGPYEDYVPVEDGDVLEYGGYEIRCVAAPGHSPGHMCLYLPQEQVMFLGDHVLFDITPNIAAWDEARDALGAYFESLQKTGSYSVVLPLAAHRSAGGSLRVRIREIRAHHEARLEEVLSIVKDRPGLSGVEITGRMHWNLRGCTWAEFPAHQKVYAVGEALAHLDYLRRRGRVVREEVHGVYRYHVEAGTKLAFNMDEAWRRSGPSPNEKPEGRRQI